MCFVHSSCLFSFVFVLWHGIDQSTSLTCHCPLFFVDGYYPFHRACWGDRPQHAETVQVFLDLGVDYDLEADNGKTCMDMTPNTTTKKILRIAERQRQSQQQREKEISEEEDEEEL